MLPNEVVPFSLLWLYLRFEIEELQNRSISPQAVKDEAACRIGSWGANRQTCTPVNLERPRVLSRPCTKIVPSSFFTRTFIANLGERLFVPPLGRQLEGGWGLVGHDENLSAPLWPLPSGFSSYFFPCMDIPCMDRSNSFRWHKVANSAGVVKVWDEHLSEGGTTNYTIGVWWEKVMVGALPTPWRRRRPCRLTAHLNAPEFRQEAE